MSQEGEERQPTSQPMRPVVLPEIFTGEGNFDDWISHFESVAAINKWSDGEKLLWLKVRLTGKAHLAFDQLARESQESYVIARKALQERFKPESKRMLYKAEFETRRKKKLESWADFSDDLRRLADKAFPTLQVKAREELALSRYLDQLSPSKISFTVKQRRPKNLHEAVSSTIELESYSPKEQSLVQSVSENGETPPSVPVQAVQQQLLGAIQKLVERVEKLEMKPPHDHEQYMRPPRKFQGQGAERRGRSVTCYRCGGRGHYARGCAATRNPSENSASGSGNVHQTEQYLNPSNQFSINNVSSYVLSCSMYTAPVSCLIDTGAGVSLLRGGVWDRIRPNNCKPSPVTAHRLVGVDGILISVRGSALIQFSVSGMVFEHEFIIADHITAEAILGLDFLEANKCVLDFSKEQLSIWNKVVSLQPHPANAVVNCVSITVKDTISVPASSEMEIMAHIDSAEERGTWLLEGVECPVLVARALVAPQRQAVPVRIINTDLTPVTLYKNIKIATAEPINDLSICAAASGNDTQQRQGEPTTQITLSHTLPNDITQAQEDKFLALLSHYSDIMADSPNKLGRTGVLQHHIDTGTAAPIRQQARRVPLPSRETIHTLLQDMLSRDIISPSKSPWASPIVLVGKKDGSTRFCVDYRKINEVTRKDAYPLPRVDDSLDTLAGSRWFSTIDLKSGYWQVEVAPEHRQKTAFCTQEGLFEFNVMPFGLCNAPATFQCLMDSVLAGLQWSACIVYIDDIIIMGRSFEEHLQNLQQVFERLRVAGLKLHPGKCQFLQKEVYFLGHIVSTHGITPDPQKTSKVKEWPTSTTVKEIQQFLGLANYYRRFIQDFATIAKPLHRLTEHNRTFQWTKECQQSFSTLKNHLTSAPVLALPNWSRPFVVGH